MSGSLLLAAAYGSLAVFAVAFVVRSVRIWRLPVHLRWELAPVPKEGARTRYGGSYLEEFEWWKKPRKESRITELAYMLSEVVFLKALFEHNRRLWWFSFPFHVGLYLLVGAAGLLTAGVVVTAAGGRGPGWGLLSEGLPLLAGLGYGLGTVGALGLLGSRIFDGRLRRFTTPVALLNLVLTGAFFATGLASVLRVESFSAEVTAVASSLLTATPAANVTPVVAAHVVVALLFLAYLPFSQMMHFVAKYFTYHQVRWDDAPVASGSSLEREVRELLEQPVTWAAPHVEGRGRSWAEIAGEEKP